jgi:hypothetical protein
MAVSAYGLQTPSAVQTEPTAQGVEALQEAPSFASVGHLAVHSLGLSVHVPPRAQATHLDWFLLTHPQVAPSSATVAAVHLAATRSQLNGNVQASSHGAPTLSVRHLPFQQVFAEPQSTLTLHAVPSVGGGPQRPAKHPSPILHALLLPHASPAVFAVEHTPHVPLSFVQVPPAH